ncbi:hypothetical protein D9M68_960490 [compost metagenome]
MHHLGFDAMALEKLDHGGRDLLGFLGVVAVGHFGAHRSARARGQGELHGEQGEVVVRAEHLFVGGHVGDHFFGVRAAIHCEQDFHGCIS